MIGRLIQPKTLKLIEGHTVCNFTFSGVDDTQECGNGKWKGEEVGISSRAPNTLIRH